MRRSAGILLFTEHDGIQVLLVHPGGPFWRNKDAGAWSIPKGEYTGGEDPRAAALRELNEEIGLRLDSTALDSTALEPGPEHGGAVDLGEVRQKGGKLVTAWAVRHDFDVSQLSSDLFEVRWPSGSSAWYPEVDRARWCTPEAARTRLVPAQTAFLDRLVAFLSG